MQSGIALTNMKVPCEVQGDGTSKIWGEGLKINKMQSGKICSKTPTRSHNLEAKSKTKKVQSNIVPTGMYRHSS